MGNRAIAADLNVNAPNPLIIKEGTTEINDDFALSYTAKREVVLPQSLRRIGLRAFSAQKLQQSICPKGWRLLTASHLMVQN